jgi:predicted HTH transcriptional regulator
MTVKELQLLVNEGEHTHLEFKRKVAHPEKIVREIVAFANTEGGNLLIGVNDDGNLSGLKYPDEDAYVLEKVIASHCKPTIAFEREYIALTEKKTIICYHIPKSENKPHYVLEVAPAADPLTAKKKKRTTEQYHKRTYFRVKDRSIQASRELREIIRRQQKPKDIRFSWGEKEQLLVQYLSEHSTITVQEFAKLAGINRHLSSRTLVLLVLGNVLQIIPAEGEDRYTMKEK